MLLQCICQGYDGATVMSGSCSGVQTRIRDLAPKAVYIHCCAHHLNLGLVDATKSIPFACEFFNLLEILYVFLSAAKAHSIFLDAQKEISPEKQTIELKRLVETRWACRYQAIQAILSTYSAILLSLQMVIDRDSSRAVETQGILHQVKRFTFILRLVLFEKLLHVTNGLLKLFRQEVLTLLLLLSLFLLQQTHLRSTEVNQFGMEYGKTACLVLLPMTSLLMRSPHYSQDKEGLLKDWKMQ